MANPSEYIERMLVVAESQLGGSENEQIVWFRLRSVGKWHNEAE
jgi:hypothetical protein